VPGANQATTPSGGEHRGERYRSPAIGQGLCREDEVGFENRSYRYQLTGTLGVEWEPQRRFARLSEPHTDCLSGRAGEGRCAYHSG